MKDVHIQNHRKTNKTLRKLIDTNTHVFRTCVFIGFFGFFGWTLQKTCVFIGFFGFFGSQEKMQLQPLLLRPQRWEV